MYGNYTLKDVTRKPINNLNSRGEYDGVFTKDYEFVTDLANIDQLSDGAQTSILDQASGHVG